MSPTTQIDPFAVKDCTLVSIATGRRAQNLRELRDHLQMVHPGSIYFHFWGGQLRPDFDDPEYNNDFASWAAHAVHDLRLAERLGVIDPAGFDSMESLRQELIDIVDERLDETEFLTWAPRDRQFHFVRAHTVVFDTGRRLRTPRELAAAIPALSLGSIYYHVIDARRREPLLIDDFRVWLTHHGEPYADLCQRLTAIDPYFITLVELRVQLATIMRGYHFRETPQEAELEQPA
jgi:hypothetical protein